MEDIPIVSMGMVETPIGREDVTETLVSSVGVADTLAGSAGAVEETSEWPIKIRKRKKIKQYI